MKRARFTEEQIIGVLKEHEAGAKTADLARKHGVSLSNVASRWVLENPAVAATILGDHPHGLIAPPDHPLAGSGPISPEALLRETMITREEGSGTRILMTRYLDSTAGGRVFDLVEMGSNETIKQAVMAGLGLAFLSLHTVTEELRHGRLVLLEAPGLPIVRQWFLVHPVDRPLTPAARTIHDLVVGLEGSYLPR